MVLVDTSIWVRFIAGREPYATDLDRLLEQEDVIGHELIYGELLIGDRGGRPALLSAYSLIPHAATVEHREVVEFVRSRGLNGMGIGWIDAHLLASCIVAGATLWTADRRLSDLAAHLGVAA